jgi:hypothetical protein
MKFTSWGVLAFVGSLIFSLLFIKNWETKMDAQKLSRTKLPRHSALDVDPNLKLVSDGVPTCGPSADTRAVHGRSEHKLHLRHCAM